MATALAIIGDEHRAFDAALAAIIDRIAMVRAHRIEPDANSFRRPISYIATFMDHFHHPKEDDFLFRAVRARTRQADDLIEHLHHDHLQAPGIFAELLRNLQDERIAKGNAFEDFAQLFERYAKSQVDHMRLENDELVPIAKSVLRLPDWIEIESAFSENRDPLFAAIASSRAPKSPAS